MGSRGTKFGNDSDLGGGGSVYDPSHSSIYSFLSTQSPSQPEKGQLCMHSNKQEMTDCLIQCKKHPLSIYQLPGFGLGTAVFSKPFPDLSSLPSVPCDLHLIECHRRFRAQWKGLAPPGCPARLPGRGNPVWLLLM